ncbi:MAG TPA: hypothetical protein VNZ01_07080 [Solirubrobacteraceae bacterium]|jgi:hypothetical protein|nr:hypothetical protein [Solirubrobacteraceae bacterium]
MNKNHVLKEIATRPTRSVVAGVLAASAAVLTVLALGLPSAIATETPVTVAANKEFTDTGLALTAGEKVTIEASGTIKFSSNGSASPAGLKFSQKSGAGATCGTVAYSGGTPFLVPGANCWSMVFKIGTSGVAFPTGTKISFTSPVAGELFLGVNDNFYGDNSGSWTAKVTTP